jgi:hypothetical protein
MVRPLRTLALTAILSVSSLVGVNACGGSDSATGPNTSINGNYALQTYNGANLPAVFFLDATERDELTGGSINLNADKTWSGTLALRTTAIPSGAVLTFSLPFSGTYTNTGSSITLTDASDDSKIAGTVSAGSLTLQGVTDFGVTATLVFRR